MPIDSVPGDDARHGPVAEVVAPDRLARDDVADDNELCRRCGVSCHLAIPVNGLPIAVPGLHCRHLTEESRGRFGCAVYANRLEVAPWCHRAKDAAPLGFLARDCPYALRDGARNGKVRPGPAALRPLWPALLAEIRSQGVPFWVAQAPLVEIFRRHAGIEVDLVADPARPDHLQVVERAMAAEQGER